MKHELTLTGVILCGGKSTRMGSDKGLLTKDGKTWVEHAFALLNDLDLPVKISVNSVQKESYGKLFNDTFLIEDNVTIPGPMAGLLSAKRQLKDQDLLVLACDMTDVTSDLVKQLISVYQKEKHKYDFFVYRNENEYEPMLGIYSYRGLQKVYELFEAGEIKKFSMKYILENGSTVGIPISDFQQKYFRNYNSKEDFS